MIKELEALFKHALMMAKTAEDKESWMKVAAYIAQTINSLANSFDEIRFNEDIQRLREMIEKAKKRVEPAGAGTPIAL